MEEDKLKYKEILCNTMKSFINICKEHNLQYYACAGTCLGAIRHKGMIPWDDDIDVLMPRSDYDKFLALKQKLQGTGYEIVDSNNQFYNQWFAKFSDANTTIVEITDFPIVFGVYDNILLQVLSFCFSCLNELSTSAFQSLLKPTPKLLFIHYLLFHRQDLRTSGQCGHSHVIVKAELIPHSFKIFYIFGSQSLVIF